ncbi:ribonuclease H-like domain-containing protein [Phakopsora pachyrhizi]|uniref:Ribonuclease n=1 Tax=Phakopsora pachyrhizi TaxID=170000 RepID=A0AAV0B2H2_PHAPC|nr:ribonuclease H-like domain-containing protein [Phakopsora pachyrhizi]CAH7690212.1 ribonuclease H-like domain-containing protein [Phakopsora pachyrhizi]
MKDSIKQSNKRKLEEEVDGIVDGEVDASLTREEEDVSVTDPVSAPPSVKPHEPLLESYLYSTVQDQQRQNNGEEYQKLKRQDWIMGVDEAGRGPVLGPMVYGAAFCLKTFAEGKLLDLGFADSKTLSHKRREELLESIVNPGPSCPVEERVEWNVKVLTAADISQGMNRQTSYNLNAQAFNATCQIIRSALDNHYNLQHIFVDTLGSPKTHQAKLEKEFPSIKFTVCSKADSIFPIVGAASVAAKVTRDAIISNWIHPEDYNRHSSKSSSVIDSFDDSIPFGSGYPADPNTVEWLKKSFDEVFGYGQIVRFSWTTIKTILSNRGPGFKW